MTRSGRRASLAVLLAMLPGLAACSTVPTSSATVQITQAPERPAPEVGIEPQSPEPGATPEEIVRNFIDAAASTVAAHPVAREHLTPEAAETWSDESGISVISPDYASVTAEEGVVKVTADLIGTVDQRGVFLVGGTGLFTREFTLEEVEGEWRIGNPPDGLILLQPDFERLYDRLQAYFLDPTGQRVVPDPRYLITGDAQPTALMNRVLEGPSAALSAGVRNPLSGDVQLRSAVSLTGQSGAVVDLTGLGTDPAPVLAEISAQVVWTLRQVGIRTVEIRVDGEPVNLDGVPPGQSTDDWPSFNPDTVPVDAVGHYLDGGALRVVTTGEATPGPAGAGEYDLTSAAVKTESRTGELSFLVGVRSAGGREQLLAGPYDGELATVLEGATLSTPSVASTRAEVWVVRDGSSIVRVQPGSVPQGVSAPTLAGLGRAEALELSPDGVRAAVVVDGPEGPTLYVGTVIRDEDGGVALRDLRAIAPAMSQVVDVAWRDSEELLVLARDAAQDRIVPYSVGVDGWGLSAVSEAGLPSQPTSIAAAPTRQPLVSADRTIWQLSGGTWVTLERGAEPRPGTEPFYPL